MPAEKTHGLAPMTVKNDAALAPMSLLCKKWAERKWLSIAQFQLFCGLGQENFDEVLTICYGGPDKPFEQQKRRSGRCSVPVASPGKTSSENVQAKSMTVESIKCICHLNASKQKLSAKYCRKTCWPKFNCLNTAEYTTWLLSTH